MRIQKIGFGVLIALLATLSTASTANNMRESLSTPLVLAQVPGTAKVEADQLLELGAMQYSSSQFEAALQSFQQAQTIYQAIGARSEEGTALNNMGLIYNNLGEYAAALKSYEQALVIFNKIHDRQGIGTIFNNIGLVYNNLGEYAAALKFYEQALLVRKEVSDRIGEGITLSNMGKVYINLGKYSQALKFYEQALLVRKEIGDHVGEGKTLTGIGVVYDEQGKYSQALKYYEQAIRIFKHLGDRDGQGAVYNNIGGVYFHQGEYTQSLKSYEQALTIRQEIGDRAGQGQTLNNMAVVYSNLAQYAQALKYYDQSLAIAKKIQVPIVEISILNNIGLVYSNLYQDSQALKYYEQALAITREIQVRTLEGTTLNNIGQVYDTQGQYSQALKYYEQALAINKEIGNPSEEGATLNNIGVVYSNLGQHTKALRYYKQALLISKQVGNRAEEGKTLNNIGYALLANGDFLEAEEKLRTTLAIWESFRPGLSDMNKVSIFDTQNHTYHFLQETFVAQNKIDNSLEIAERGRTRAFVELLMRKLSTQWSISSTPTYPTIEQIQQTAKVQKATLVEYSITADNFKINSKLQGRESKLYIWVIKPTGEINFRQIDLKPLWQQQNTSLKDIVIKNLQSVSTGTNRGVSNNSNLSSQLSFAPGDLVRLNDDRPNSLAWQVVAVNPQNRTLKLRLPDWQQGLTIPRPFTDATKVASPHSANPYLQQLHKLLIEPISDLLPTDPKQRVIFIPQGALFFVPFPALQDKNRDYLIQKHTILTAPSIQVLDLTRKQRQQLPPTVKDVLVVGNPTMPKVAPFPGEPAQQLSSLPAAEEEAKAVAQMFKTQPLIGTQATKTAILSQMPKARIIHLATHGLLDDFTGGGVPGAIALSPDITKDKPETNNGLLTANEILDLKLNAELVVLSACNTGQGRITGDGVIGLSRSLISAGVPSVVVSLWSVPDAPTASLMTEFYHQMQDNSDKAAALRQAMLKTMQQNPNPKDWAAFTLIGEAE